MKAFTWKNEGDASEAVTQKTDISGPSPPIVVNLTCHNQDALYLRWKRPLEYYNSIDFYIISYRIVSQHDFQEIKFNASATHLETAVIFIAFYGFGWTFLVLILVAFSIRIDGFAESNDQQHL